MLALPERHDVSKTLIAQAAIAGVTFQAAGGEVLGIVGPNGAGKTTLLKALVGLIATDSGRVSWLGDALSPSRRKRATFYLPDGVRPYQNRFTIGVLNFFTGDLQTTVGGGEQSHCRF
jgi:ABC-2 type transport system ATP-binding protein